MDEHKKPSNKVELHVIPISIQCIPEVGDSIDSCMETRKKEVLSRNRSAVTSACPSRRSFASRRCFTAVERPKRSKKFCQACAYQDVKQVEQDMEVVGLFLNTCTCIRILSILNISTFSRNTYTDILKGSCIFKT